MVQPQLAGISVHKGAIMAPPAGSTPAAHHISLFTKGSDGTADFGLRYSPLTGIPTSLGLCHCTLRMEPQKNVGLAGSSSAEYAQLESA